MTCIGRIDVTNVFYDFTTRLSSDSISRVLPRLNVMIQLRRFLLLFGVLTMLTGCSIVVDVVRDKAEQRASVPAGTLISGDGFTVHSPVDGLRVVRDKPRKGFICLRFTTELMFFGAGSYDIFPFSLDTPAPTLRDAWSTNALTFFTAQGRASYHILSEHTGTWQGQPAYFQVACSPPFSQTEGFVIYSCLIRHGSKYYWVIRSVGLPDNRPDTLQRARAQSEKQLPAFLNSLSFTVPPAT